MDLKTFKNSDTGDVPKGSVLENSLMCAVFYIGFCPGLAFGAWLITLIIGSYAFTVTYAVPHIVQFVAGDVPDA